METIIIQSDGKKLQKVKDFLISLNISFEVKEADGPYDPEFVAKIERSREQARQGKTIRIKTEDLWK